MELADTQMHGSHLIPRDSLSPELQVRVLNFLIKVVVAILHVFTDTWFREPLELVMEVLQY